MHDCPFDDPDDRRLPPIWAMPGHVNCKCRPGEQPLGGYEVPKYVALLMKKSYSSAGLDPPGWVADVLEPRRN